MDHFLVDELRSGSSIPVFGKEGSIGTQRMRLIAPNTALKLTKLRGATGSLRTHALKLLQHTPLKAIYWANLNNKQVTLTTIRP